ncbi:MAG: hypothetical protein P8L85_18255, partial [Rubripirellula sp.]|nr:hypothetical protein [Rubripirellula sp.]
MNSIGLLHPRGLQAPLQEPSKENERIGTLRLFQWPDSIISAITQTPRTIPSTETKSKNVLGCEQPTYIESKAGNSRVKLNHERSSVLILPSRVG